MVKKQRRWLYLFGLILLAASIFPFGSVIERVSAAAPRTEEQVRNATFRFVNRGILDILVVIINVLSGLVGIVVIASIIVAGIQYSTAGNDPQKVNSAKNRIRNAIIALLFFIFAYAFLNYLVPGGVLGQL